MDGRVVEFIQRQEIRDLAHLAGDARILEERVRALAQNKAFRGQTNLILYGVVERLARVVEKFDEAMTAEWNR